MASMENRFSAIADFELESASSPFARTVGFGNAGWDATVGLRGCCGICQAVGRLTACP
jgi:hypothetical protein